MILVTRDLKRRVMDAIAIGDFIDEDSAQTIASLWHSPSGELSLLSHGMECDSESYGSMLIELTQEMRKTDSFADLLYLNELYAWIRFEMAKPRIDCEDL